MAAQAELSRETYNQNIHSLITTKSSLEAANDILAKISGGSAISQIGGTGVWKSNVADSVFSYSRATVDPGKDYISNLRMDNYSNVGPNDGIRIKGDTKNFAVEVNQDYSWNEDIATTVRLLPEETKDSVGETNIQYRESIKGPDVVSGYDVYFDLNENGIGEVKRLGMFGEDRVLSFQLNKTSNAWEAIIEDKPGQILNDDIVRILREAGIHIPTSIKQKSVGITVKSIIDGRNVEISVPSGMPTQDIFKSFAHGEPLTKFSVRVDGEERVSQVSGDEAKKWHDQVSKIALSKNEVDEHLTVTKQFDGGGCEASINEGGLFAHNHITLKKIQNKAQGVEDAYSLNHVYQRKVDRDEDDQLGVNVIENYNATDAGKILSDVYLKSNKGFAFRLRSEMLNGSRNFNHSFYMQLSEQNMTNLRINNKIALFAGDSEQNPSDHFYVEMTDLHSFELRKYAGNDMEGDYEVFEIDNNLLKDLFGFEIDPRDIYIEGPVAHVGLSMREHRYSVTVPSSFGGDVKTNLFEKGQSLVPMSIFTDAEGGWRDVMQRVKE